MKGTRLAFPVIEVAPIKVEAWNGIFAYDSWCERGGAPAVKKVRAQGSWQQATWGTTIMAHDSSHSALDAYKLQSDNSGPSRLKRKAYEKVLRELQTELCSLQDWVKRERSTDHHRL